MNAENMDINPPHTFLAPQPQALIANEAEDDDDVIFIPEVIETIDLCGDDDDNSSQVRLVNNPMLQPPQQYQLPPLQNNIKGEIPRTAPSQHPSTSKKTEAEDDTVSVKLPCAICFESIVNRNPVSTFCGHLFCKKCIQTNMKTNKKCPLCQKHLTPKKIHDVFLG